jgi:hypothetical protein
LGIILLIIAVCFGLAACMDLLLLSKVNTQKWELYCCPFGLSCHEDV